MNYITVGNCKKEIERLDPALDKKSDAFKAAVILMYGSLSGKRHWKTFFVRTGYDVEFIKMVTKNLKANGIWVGNKTAADWSNEETGGMEFWIHVSVALGLMELA